METFGTFFDDEWNTLSKIFVENKDVSQFVTQDYMSSQYDLGLNCKFPDFFLSGDESNNAESLIYASDNTNPSSYHFFSQENSNCSSGASNSTLSLPYPSDFCYSDIIPSQSNNLCDESFGFCPIDEINHSSTSAQVFSDESLYLTRNTVVEKVKIDNSVVHGTESSLKRKFEMHDEVSNEKTDKSSKKRARVSKDNKTKKIKQSMKNKNMNDEDESNNHVNGERNGRSSSSCSSEDDLNGVPNSNGKTRASRGAATDPQSIYARKRRERINERLRILQNLVPNGTKVDISTMLEEAVEYVKFLKLQIQLLSSDDMWMYAPIAYNGMNMGLYQSITPNQ